MLDDDFLTLVIRARVRVGRDRDASRRNAWTHARFTRADLHARELVEDDDEDGYEMPVA